MAIKYESVVPWGRTFEEYVDMFRLTVSDLGKYILGCGDGPASDLHIQSINEMLRVSREVRIFPLLDVNAKRSLYAEEVINKYIKMDYYVDETKVDYEFQKGGNTMLKIARKERE